MSILFIFFGASCGQGMQTGRCMSLKVLLMNGITELSNSGRMKKRVLIAILFISIVGALSFGEFLSFETLAENRENFLRFRETQYITTVMVFIGAYLIVVAFSLPGATAMTLTGGFLFSTFPGVFFNVVGATLGAVFIFTVARWGLGERLAQKMNAEDGAVKRIKEGIDKNQWSMLFLIRLIPIVPFFVANLVPALVGVTLRRFAITTFFGIMPGALVFTSVGAGLGDAFDWESKPNLGIIFTPQILLPILGLCVLAALPIVSKIMNTRK